MHAHHTPCIHRLGVEIAKNIILAGPGAVTLVDSAPATIRDMGANFYIRQEDIDKGLSRAEASIGQLKELNGRVDVNIAEKLTEDLVGTHDVLVMTGTDRSELLRWNDFCRSFTKMTTDSRGKRTIYPSPIKVRS